MNDELIARAERLLTHVSDDTIRGVVTDLMAEVKRQDEALERMRECR